MYSRITSVYYLILIPFFFCQMVWGQNLVQNPSFEDFNACPSEYGSLEQEVPYWYQPTYGSSDYFNTCSEKMPAQANFIGEQSPFDGDGYAGLYAYGPRDYREYLTVALSEPLKRGTKYVFSFQVSLAEKSTHAVNEFGVLFTKRQLNMKTKRNIPIELMRRKGYDNYTQVRNHRYYAEQEEWSEVAGIYTADGTESFMTIGNFNGNINTKFKEIDEDEEPLKKVSYYYVDMFSLTALEGSYQDGEIYVFNNLQFELDGYTIDKTHQDELDKLVAYLKAHRGHVISIFGHTDNLGSKTYNKDLSQKRAESVANFLIENGLSPHRIAWRGFGDLNPIVKNKTEKDREKNRRVEFIVSRKKRDYYASGVFEDDN